MFLLADDPHHMHTDMDHFYYFLVLAIVLVVVMLIAGWRILTYLERRRIAPGNDATAGKAKIGASASKGSEGDASIR